MLSATGPQNTLVGLDRIRGGGARQASARGAGGLRSQEDKVEGARVSRVGSPVALDHSLPLPGPPAVSPQL